MDEVTKPEFVPSPWNASHIKKDLLSGRPQFRLIDISDKKILCESSWLRILRIKRGKAIRLVLKEDTGLRRPSLSSSKFAASLPGNGIGTNMSTAADPKPQQPRLLAKIAPKLSPELGDRRGTDQQLPRSTRRHRRLVSIESLRYTVPRSETCQDQLQTRRILFILRQIREKEIGR